MTLKMLRYMIALGIVILVVGAIVRGQNSLAQTDRTVSVTISAPRDGSGVGHEITVRGTARIPPDGHLWVVARRAGMFDPLWFLQRTANIDPRTGAFSATAFLGNPGTDVGAWFDVGVVTVDAVGHQRLMETWTKSTTTGDFRPVRLPDTTSPPRIIKVRKTSGN